MCMYDKLLILSNIELLCERSSDLCFEPRENLDQPGLPRNLIRVFAVLKALVAFKGTVKMRTVKTLISLSQCLQ